MLLQAGNDIEPGGVVHLLNPIGMASGHFSLDAKFSREREFLTESVDRALQRFHHGHALIPQEHLWVRKGLNLRNDGLRRLPPSSGCLNVRIVL